MPLKLSSLSGYRQVVVSVSSGSRIQGHFKVSWLLQIVDKDTEKMKSLIWQGREKMASRDMGSMDYEWMDILPRRCREPVSLANLKWGIGNFRIFVSDVQIGVAKWIWRIRTRRVNERMIREQEIWGDVTALLRSSLADYHIDEVELQDMDNVQWEKIFHLSYPHHLTALLYDSIPCLPISL